MKTLIVLALPMVIGAIIAMAALGVYFAGRKKSHIQVDIKADESDPRIAMDAACVAEKRSAELVH